MRKPEFVVQVCLTPVERLSADGRTVPLSAPQPVKPAPPAVRPAPRPAPAATPAPARQARPGPGLVRRNIPLLTILGVLAAINLAGLTYYASPIADRVRSPLHAWLKPSGYIGQSAACSRLEPCP